MTKPLAVNDEKITQEEMFASFGERIPIEAAQIMMRHGQTCKAAREELNGLIKQQSSATHEDDLIEKLKLAADSLAGDQQPCNAAAVREAATAIASLREERDELKLEVSKIKHGDGWRAFEDAKAELGSIIKDDYAERSMWPRLHRVKTWWDDMKARKDRAEERVRVLEGALRPFAEAIRRTGGDSMDPDVRLDMCREDLSLFEFGKASAAIMDEQTGAEKQEA